MSDFSDYMKTLGYTDQDLATNGFWQTNSNGNGYGFLGFTDPSQGNSWLGGQGILPTAFQGLQALTGGLNAFTGLQQLALAKDQYNLAKNVANANLNNSVENYYNAIKNANRVGYALQGGYAKKAYGANSQEAAATNAAEEATKNLTRHV